MTAPEDYERWELEVRDPADAAKEAGQALTTRHHSGAVEAKYTLVQIPTGWAIRYSAELHGHSYRGTPWRLFPSRDAAIEAARGGIQSFCRHLCCGDYQRHADKVLAAMAQDVLL